LGPRRAAGQPSGEEAPNKPQRDKRKKKKFLLSEKKYTCGTKQRRKR